MSKTIHRTPKNADHPFTQIRRAVFEDKRLSWEARGLLAYLLVKPDDWQINISNLINEGSSGRDKTYRILGELIGHGYIDRTEERNDGKIAGYQYTLYEDPADNPHFSTNRDQSSFEPLPENPDTAKPLPANPLPAEPYPANPDHTNKEDLLNTKKATKKGGVPDPVIAEPLPEPSPFPPTRQAYTDRQKSRLFRADYDGIDPKLLTSLTNELKRIYGMDALIGKPGKDSTEDKLRAEAYELWKIGYGEVEAVKDLRDKWRKHTSGWKDSTPWGDQLYEFALRVVGGTYQNGATSNGTYQNGSQSGNTQRTSAHTGAYDEYNSVIANGKLM